MYLCKVIKQITRAATLNRETNNCCAIGIRAKVMTERSFLNAKQCNKVAKRLKESAKAGGLEDLDVISEEIVVSPDQCETAADFIETAGEKGGNYFCNIVNYPIFSHNEIKVILQHL